MLSPEQRAQSDAYFEGGYWLAALVAALRAGRHGDPARDRRAAGALRDLAERVSRPAVAQSSAVYAAAFLVANFVLNLPLSIYQDFLREHQYGLSNLSFPGWLREQLIGLALTRRPGLAW